VMENKYLASFLIAVENGMAVSRWLSIMLWHVLVAL
jgi:hypothetical protein